MGVSDDRPGGFVYPPHLLASVAGVPVSYTHLDVYKRQHLDRTLAELLPEARPAIYVASPHYRHPTLAFLSANYDAVKWLPGSHALVFPATGEALTYYCLLYTSRCV